jgi:hypothetical protein
MLLFLPWPTAQPGLWALSVLLALLLVSAAWLGPVALAATLSFGLAGLAQASQVKATSSRSAPKQGVSIVAGPRTNVQLHRPYTYKFRITTDRAYKEAFVMFVSPSACLTKTSKVMKLAAHMPATTTLSITFLNTYVMQRAGIEVAITSSPNGKKAHFILSKTFSLTPALPNHSTDVFTLGQCPNLGGGGGPES